MNDVNRYDLAGIHGQIDLKGQDRPATALLASKLEHLRCNIGTCFDDAQPPGHFLEGFATDLGILEL